MRTVTEDRYLLRLIAHIHLNPVGAGIVTDPSAYRWSGHRELLGRSEEPLTDVDAVLALFGRQRAGARRAYVRMLRGERGQPWVGEQPGRLPWWGRGGDEDVDGGAWEPTPSGGMRGVAEQVTVRDVDAFIRRSARELGVASEDLISRRKAPAAVRAREIIAIVGVERFGVKVAELAVCLKKNPGSVSRWLVQAAERRQKEREFEVDCERLEAAVANAGSAHRR